MPDPAGRIPDVRRRWGINPLDGDDAEGSLLPHGLGTPGGTGSPPHPNHDTDQTDRVGREGWSPPSGKPFPLLAETAAMAAGAVAADRSKSARNGIWLGR